MRDLAHTIEDMSTTASKKVKKILDKKSTKKVAARAQGIGKIIMRNVREAINPDKKDK